MILTKGCATTVYVNRLYENRFSFEISFSLYKFCGRTIAGISLLSSSIMRLKVDGKPDDLPIDILLEPRSLYIMK